MNSSFDAHCHIFPLRYLKQEIVAMLVRLLREHNADPSRPRGFEFPVLDHLDSSPLKRLLDLVRNIHGFWDAAMGDEDLNLGTVMHAQTDAWGQDTSSHAVVLMMDILYMFTPPMEAGQTREQWLARAGGEHGAGPIGFLEKQALKAFLKLNGLDDDHDLGSLLSDGPLEHPLGFEDSLGYKTHREALIRLESQHKGRVYPFLAIDPRRRGIVDAVLRNTLVTKTGPFHGIKLYPKVGYHPACAELDRLFAWCVEQDIPVITHSGPEGFPPWDTPADNWCRPEAFKPVLDAHPGLRIDFAHFGFHDTGWRDAISDAIRRTDCEVYTDVACFTEPSQWSDFLEFHRANPHLQSRTMYGTDFDVMYFAGAGHIDMPTYYEQFGKGLLPGELETMAWTVPSRFLRLPGAQDPATTRRREP